MTPDDPALGRLNDLVDRVLRQVAAYGLLCKLGELTLDAAAAVAHVWRTRTRTRTRTRSRALTCCSDARTEAQNVPDPFLWVGAQTVLFEGDQDDGSWTELESPVAPKEPPGAAADARCPTCPRQMLPVLYGYPSGDMFDAAERGLIILGGCMPGEARYRCPSCDDPWSSQVGFGDQGAPLGPNHAGDGWIRA